MNRILRLSALVASALVAVGALSTTASAAEAIGSVKGKVVKADGSPAIGAQVVLVSRAGGKKGDVGSTGDGAGATAPDAKAEGNAARRARATVAQATTDEHGQFTLADVPAGRYVVGARVKGEGNARHPVSVNAGSPTEVTMKLKSREQRRADRAAAPRATAAERQRAREERIERRRQARATRQQAAEQPAVVEKQPEWTRQDHAEAR